MPYKITGNTVYVYRSGRWQVKKKHPTRKAALAHFRALKINVKES